MHLGVIVTLNDWLDYFGPTVNMAARLQGQSEGRDIVLSRAVPVIPGIVAGFLGPVIEIVLVAARPDHAVDAGAATDGLAHGLRDRAVVDARATFSAEVPVEFAALVEKPGLGDQDAGLQILAARFEQEHLRVPVLGQASRHDRAGRARTDDDVIVVGLQGGAASRAGCRRRP